MREFERAIERGQDTAVATFVLEQLRKIVRKHRGRTKRRRRAPTIRRGCCSGRWSRSWSTAMSRSGRARSAAPRCTPIWQWLVRDGAPGQARRIRGGAGAHAGDRQSAPRSGAAQAPARRRRRHLPADSPAGGDKQRALARVGAPNVIEDLLPIGAVLQAREAHGDAQWPAAELSCACSANPQIASVDRGAERPVAADAAAAAVRAVAGDAAADCALADHPPRHQDGGVRRRDPRRGHALWHRRHHRAARSVLSGGQPAHRYQARPFRQRRRQPQDTA